MIFIKGINLPKITGIALWPFVLLKSKTPDKVIINHEKIHIRQQSELLVLFFYLWYIIEWLFKYIACRNFDIAYRNICFEREAFANENNLEYLKTRPFWAFLKYL